MKTYEYKGEKILGTLTARLVPPDSRYPDSMCQLTLTPQHLYVLEDNFDGTFETHFSFTLSQIQKISVVKNTKSLLRPTKCSPSILNSLIAVLSPMGCLFVLLGSERQYYTMYYLKIHYKDNPKGEQILYFNDFQTSSKAFRTAFAKAKGGKSGIY